MRRYLNLQRPSSTSFACFSSLELLATHSYKIRVCAPWIGKEISSTSSELGRAPETGKKERDRKTLKARAKELTSSPLNGEYRFLKSRRKRKVNFAQKKKQLSSVKIAVVHCSSCIIGKGCSKLVFFPPPSQANA